MSDNNLIIGGNVIDTTTISSDLLPDIINSPEVVKQHQLELMNTLKNACQTGGFSLSISITGEWFMIRASGRQYKGDSLESLISRLVKMGRPTSQTKP